MDFAGVNETFDVDNLRALELDLGKIVRRHDHVLLRLELITLDDLFRRERLPAFLAFFFVTNGAVIVLVQLVEPDRFFRVNGVVDPDRDGNQRKSNVTLPYRSHNSPRFSSMVAFIGLTSRVRAYPVFTRHSRFDLESQIRPQPH